MKETNTQFLNRMMDYSRFGAMTQLVVLHAIRYYCEVILKDPEAVLCSMEDHPISGDAWVGAVKELSRELNAHFEHKTDRPVAGMRRSA